MMDLSFLAGAAVNHANFTVQVPPGFVAINRGTLLVFWLIIGVLGAAALMIPAIILYRLGPVGRVFLGGPRRLILAFDPSGTYEFYPAYLDSTALRVDHKYLKGYFFTQEGSAYKHRAGPMIYPADVVSGTTVNVRMANYANRLAELPRSGDHSVLGMDETERASLIGWRPLVIYHYAQQLKEIKAMLEARKGALVKELEMVRGEIEEAERVMGIDAVKNELDKIKRELQDTEGSLRLVKVSDSSYPKLEERRNTLLMKRELLLGRLREYEERNAEYLRRRDQLEEVLKEYNQQLEATEKELEKANRAAAVGDTSAYTLGDYQRMTRMLLTQPKEKIPMWVLGESINLQKYANYVLTGVTPSNILQLVKHREEAIRRSLKQENMKTGLIVMGIIALVIVAIVAAKLLGG